MKTGPPRVTLDTPTKDRLAQEAQRSGPNYTRRRAGTFSRRWDTRVTGVKGGKEETAGEGGEKEDSGMEDKTKHQQK